MEKKKSIRKSTTKKTNSTKKSTVSPKTNIKKTETSKKEIKNNKPNYKKYLTKKSIIIGLLAFIFIVVIIIILCCSIDKKGYAANVELTAYSDGLYAWEYKIKDKSIVKYVEKKRTGDIEGKTTGKITEYYTFKALKQGKTTIKFTFRNTYNQSFLDVYEYNVIVDKDLNLTIEKKK